VGRSGGGSQSSCFGHKNVLHKSCYFFLEHVDQRNLYRTHECYSYFTLKIGLRAAASAYLVEVSLCFCTYVPIGLHKYSYFSSVCMIQGNQKVSVHLIVL
jgi:hypothetical protein